jgi:hypothetical protein
MKTYNSNKVAIKIRRLRSKTLLSNSLLVKKEETKETTRMNSFLKNNVSLKISTRPNKMKEKRPKLSNKMRWNRLNTKIKFTNNSKNNRNRKIINLFKRIKLNKIISNIRK